MKHLSKINETHWGGMVRRSNPEKEVRKEDIIGNLKDINWIDVGDDVLWADRDLIFDDEEFFTKIPNIDFPKGIRLPNMNDTKELMGIDRTIGAGASITIPNLKPNGDNNIKIKSVDFQLYPQKILNGQIFDEYSFFIDDEFFKYFTIRYYIDLKNFFTFTNGFNIEDNDKIKIRLVKENEKIKSNQ